MANISDNSKTIAEIWHDLEQLQLNLLLIKAAGLAYQGCFQDCPLITGRTDQPDHHIAEYFIYQFLDLDPEQKLEAAMRAISALENELKKCQNPPKTEEVQPKTKKTSSHTIKISIDGDES